MFTVIGCSMQEDHSLNKCSMFTVCGCSIQGGDFLTDAQCQVTICGVMVTISMKVEYKQVTSITSGDKQQVTLTDVQCLLLLVVQCKTTL